MFAVKDKRCSIRVRSNLTCNHEINMTIFNDKRTSLQQSNTNNRRKKLYSCDLTGAKFFRLPMTNKQKFYNIDGNTLSCQTGPRAYLVLPRSLLGMESLHLHQFYGSVIKITPVEWKKGKDR